MGAYIEVESNSNYSYKIPNNLNQLTLIVTQGTLTGSTDEIEGSIIIPNLSDENTVEEVVVDVTVTTNSSAAFSLKEMIRTSGANKIKEQLAKYIKSLQEGCCLFDSRLHFH